MSRRRKNRLPEEPVELEIQSLSHDGRGVARDSEGKTCFVDAALPGERVSAKYLGRRKRFDELKAEEVMITSPQRVEPPCPHANLCGGCSLQHLEGEAQIRLKEATLKEQFAHFGGIEPEHWEAPMVADTLGYRRKARLGVRYVKARDEVLVGFREKRNSFITDIRSCAVLDPRVGERIVPLRQLIRELSIFDAIPQVEVACGDDTAALVFRHMAPFNDADIEKLCTFGQEHDLQIYLQPKGPNTIHRLWPESDEPERLAYALDGGQLSMAFHPSDFTQVNAGINERMVNRAMAWLDLNENDRVLDLFCGLGNFTLPLARRAGEVVGVEGDESMVVRGRENAKRNGIAHARFHGANLQADFTAESWAAEGFNKILIDPPRSGALDVVQNLARFGADRIVYVSCNPATLARDAGELVAQGYRLVRAGVMDMFPHTTHVESMALFEK
ncbi:23S rRNA (uracil(1939)-C(5))-methyltransferase RlmD [Marinobacteraceae bacterium S3BR75-40.1]